MCSERVEITPNVWCGGKLAEANDMIFAVLCGVGGVDVQIFVAGAGSREVASCGGGECRCDIGIGV